MSWGGYTPSMRAAKSSYVSGAEALLARGGYASNVKVLGGEFDRFLAKVRAEAWDEGYEAAARYHDLDTEFAAPNPYREETHD